MLSGFAAAATLLAANAVQAAASIDLFDDRAAKQKGYDLIYEARDLDLPQSVRDGLTQVRGCCGLALVPLAPVAPVASQLVERCQRGGNKKG